MFVAALVVGVALGWLRGGRLGALGEVPIHRWWLLPAAAVLHLGVPLLLPGYRGDAAMAIGLAVALYGALAAFLLSNLRLPGAYPALAGTLGNAVATVWGGGRMPVWIAAARRLGPRLGAALAAGGLHTHGAMARPAGIGWLGDVLPVPAPLPPEVVSGGDLLLALGLAWFLARAMRPRS